MTINNLLMTAIMPHPPIMLEEVGGKEIPKVQISIDGANQLSQKIVSLEPELIVIITPHSVFDRNKFGIYYTDRIIGNMARFGVSGLTLNFPGDKQFADKLVESAKNEQLEMQKFPENLGLDHGSFVPLYFLNKAGYKAKVCVINYCGLDRQSHLKFGRIIKETIENYGEKAVFIASGDLSHKVTINAPAGYCPEGKIFDNKLIELVKQGDYKDIINLDQTLRHQAGECAYNSLMVAFGILNGLPVHNHIYSYEAPFGVGYLVAEL
ncbi:MAG: AmmeMemoRadiSam system protein B [bacterium]